MSPRRLAVRAYRELDVPVYVISTTVAIWPVVGAAAAIHFDAFDMPPGYHLFVGLVAGGFAGAFFYILFACE